MTQSMKITTFNDYYFSLNKPDKCFFRFAVVKLLKYKVKS